jgi:DNA polymerase III epsilon subunit-like protein
MAGIIYYVCDLETNGLAWKNNFHEIFELSIIRASDRTQLSRFIKVNKPENSSFDALKITGKTLADLKNGISQKELVADVENFVAEDNLTPEHRCLIGHNIINFDRKFLWQLWSNHNKLFPFSLYLDTMQLMRKYAKQNQIIKPKINLHASCELLQIKKVAGQHDAVSDTRNTYLLWEKLIKHIDHLSCIKRIPHGDEE